MPSLKKKITLKNTLVMDKLSIIIEGWKNVLVGKNFDIQEAQRRAEICAKCPFMEERLGLAICTKCGCPLAAKTKSMRSTCPINKWNENGA